MVRKSGKMIYKGMPPEDMIFDTLIVNNNYRMELYPLLRVYKNQEFTFEYPEGYILSFIGYTKPHNERYIYTICCQSLSRV